MIQFHRPTQNFLVGKNQPVLAFADYKLVVLTAQLSILCAFICLLYLVIDLYNGVNDSWPFQLSCTFLSSLSFFLNRKGQHYWAKVLLIFSSNITVFIFTIFEPVEIGVAFLFIACYTVSIAIFGFEDRKTTFVFLLITTLLIIFSTVIDLHLFSRRIYTPQYIKLNLNINLLITSLTSTLIVYFLISLNYFSETSLRASEKILQEKNEELNKVNKELDRFVYSTSHDLRSPISSVRGLINILQSSGDASEIKSYLKMMDERMIHLDKFISDISSYSRNSRVDLKLKPVLLREVIKQCVTGLMYSPEAERMEVNINIHDELTLLSDQTRLEIVLGNIITNAFKYQDRAKENSTIEISANLLPSTIEITISDNGIGIPSEHVTKIFDMFFQAHDRAKGSGLGLYIVKETLEKLKGSITVSTEIAKGSTFTIILPREYDLKS